MPKSQNGSLEDRRLRWLVEDLNQKLIQKDNVLCEVLKNKLGIDIEEY